MKPYTSFRPSRGPNPSGSGRGLGSRQRFYLAYHAVEDRHQALAGGLVARLPAGAIHRLHQPAERAIHVAHRAAERAVHRLTQAVEDVVHHVAVLVEKLAPRVSDLVDLLSLHVLRDDEPLFLEPLQGRVDRPGRRRIAAVHLVFQLLHHLVAVARLVLHELEDHVLHVPRFEPLAASTPSSWASPKPRGSKAEGECVPSEMPSHTASLCAM